MTSPDEYTLGELVRGMNQLRDEINRLREDMNRRFADLRPVHSDVFEERSKATGQRIGQVEADIAEIQGRSARTFQLVMASLILPILVALVITGLVTRGGN